MAIKVVVLLLIFIFSILLLQLLPYKKEKKFMEMDPRLREAAETGNIDALHVLIGDDPYILERIDQVPFIQTPLHIAADKGHVSFAMEMMNLKPSFAKKLNPNGFSPMHMALRTEQTKLVLRLLKTDKDLVRVKGWEGMTPFHYVVTTGNSRLLVNFLEACPECIEDVTVRDETALHLALKQDQIEAFSLLIGWLQRTRQTHGSVFSFEKKMANWKDDQDNTLLHIAAKKNQHEVCAILFQKSLLINYYWMFCFPLMMHAGTKTVVRFPTLVTR
ncbi:putative Ankyrin repeat-containing protein [Hibiscus syriacus]|uniref:Ankyrin repeat-containing protein n=1 Tax=Hibiscus syriacus TaxID=106335 RepID=A0A6A3BD27_HIBSY|nr:putative Ankyrin repeat-containing protein [Hibiscus syriacus]